MSTNSTNSTENQQAADQLDQSDTSLPTLISSLVFNAVICLAIYLVFCLLRPRNRNVYAPRTYMIEKSKRSAPLPPGPFSWISLVLRAPDNELLYKIGLDAYMLLRFFRAAVRIFAIMSVLGLIVLLPLHITGEGNLAGLDKLGLGNISNDNNNRLWAHLILIWILVLLIIYTLHRELRSYVHLRHKYVTSSENRRLARSVTVLITSIPPEFQSEAALKELFEGFPGGVAYVTLVSNVDKLIKPYESRNATALSVEAAEFAYIRTGEQAKSKSFPLMGGSKKQETAIQFSRRRLNELEKALAEARASTDRKVLPAAFITFNNQRGAQLAAQAVSSAIPLKMVERWTEVHPDDVIWPNLSIGGIDRWWRRGISILICIALVITWAIIVTAVAGVASLQSLAQRFTFLSGVLNWDPKIVGIIQGVLPPLAIAILMFFLPIILRRITLFEGVPLNTACQLSLMHKYFFFLVVNVLLVVTFAGGIFKSLNDLKNNPSSAINILATQMPLVSTFFLTYIILGALSGSSQQLLMIGPFVVKWAKRRFLVKTPRQIWENKAMPSIEWGLVVPTHVLIFIIGITYAIIAPIILPITFIYFALYYLVFRYQCLYVYDQSEHANMNGRVFPIIVSHLFAGIYIAVLTSIGILGLRKVPIQSALAVVLLILVIISNIYIERAFRKLLNHVPVSVLLEADKAAADGGNSLEAAFGVKRVGSDEVFEHPQLKFSETNLHTDSFNKEDIQVDGSGGGHVTSPAIQPEANVSAKEYLHPALHQPAPVVWLPDDSKAGNRAEGECRDLNSNGIVATTKGAILGENNRVIVIPDEVPLLDESSIHREVRVIYTQQPPTIETSPAVVVTTTEEEIATSDLDNIQSQPLSIDTSRRSHTDVEVVRRVEKDEQGRDIIVEETVYTTTELEGDEDGSSPQDA